MTYGNHTGTIHFFHLTFKLISDEYLQTIMRSSLETIDSSENATINNLQFYINNEVNYLSHY